MDCSPPGSSVHRDSSGKSTGVGCHILLQGIFPAREPRSPTLQADSSAPEPPGKHTARLTLEFHVMKSSGCGRWRKTKVNWVVVWKRAVKAANWQSRWAERKVREQDLREDTEEVQGKMISIREKLLSTTRGSRRFWWVIIKYNLHSHLCLSRETSKTESFPKWSTSWVIGFDHLIRSFKMSQRSVNLYQLMRRQKYQLIHPQMCVLCMCLIVRVKEMNEIWFEVPSEYFLKIKRLTF